ncbi:LLM class flavin-dependent oxidoreductase [Streptomyces gamaensis]|uniref:LLM class flavin-dependent oxidoreductase n=1 Tax=Streptomyces gamaensis TaxID=1763542 RepID=A0ABW0YVP6_9ACTN
MSGARPVWDVVLPQGAAGELAGTTGPESWQLLLRTAGLARDLGYGRLWLLDRTDTLPRREPLPVWEGWTALAALAAALDGPGLGLLSAAPPFRNAALLAKRAACLDVLSGGRLELGLSTAEYGAEHVSTGAAPEGPYRAGAGHRALAETVAALRALWRGDPVTVAGEHVRLSAAHCVPVPSREGLPLAVRAPAGAGADAEHGAEPLPDAVVRECDAVQWSGDPQEVARAVEEFGRRRARLGLDPAGVRHALVAECRIFDSVLERDRWLASPHEVVFWSHHPDLLARRSLYGTPGQVADRAGRYVAAGIGEFVVWFRDYPSTESLRRLAEEVVPHVPLPAGPRGTGADAGPAAGPGPAQRKER